MGRERHASFTVKTQCFVHFGISCALGKRKKWDERHMQHLPVKTQGFLQFGISCELGNRKNGTGSTKVALTCENTFCAAWNQLRIGLEKKGRETDIDRQEAFTCEKPMFCAVWNKISSMQSVMFPQQSLETKRCEHIREREYQLGRAACRTPQLVP